MRLKDKVTEKKGRSARAGAMRLKDKVTILTGAGSGIGRVSALVFAREGAKVVATDVDEELGRETEAAIKKGGGEGFFVPLDVTDREASRKLVKDVVQRYGRVDVLINNAGIAQDALVSKMTEEQWNAVIDVNLKGAFNCIQAVIGAMVDQGSGVIINTSSVVGIEGNIGQVNYSAAKAGLLGMTKTLAKEVGKKGVRVNAIAPGFIVTPLTAGVPDKVLEMVKEKTPLRRLGDSDDVAYAYVYLASDEAKFVNGAVLSVDGGLVL